MNFEEAKSLISTKYKLRDQDKTSCEIVIEKFLNPFNLYFIALKKNNDNCYLTDFGATFDVFDIDERDEDKIIELINFYGLSFDDYHIVKDFNSLDDLDSYIKFLDVVSDLYQK